jgi:hypothetical protein
MPIETIASYEAVEAAARSLIDKGETPSSRKVQKVLGGGGLGKIQEMLRKFMAENQLVVVQIPPERFKPALKSICDIANELIVESIADIQSEMEILNVRLVEVTAEKDKGNEKIKLLDDCLEVSFKETSERNGRISELENSLREAKATIEEMQRLKFEQEELEKAQAEAKAKITQADEMAGAHKMMEDILNKRFSDINEVLEWVKNNVMLSDTGKEAGKAVEKPAVEPEKPKGRKKQTDK